MICIHHDDMDGITAAAVVHKYYKSKNISCEFRETTYGKPFNFDELKGKDVVIVDFSFKLKEMKLINSIAKSLTWIDHHVTAIKELQDLDIEKLVDIRKSGCQLTWEYYFKTQKIPKSINLIGRYDIWDHRDPECLPFQLGIKSFSLDPTSEVFEILLEEGRGTKGKEEEILQVGKITLDYQQKEFSKYAKQSAFEKILKTDKGEYKAILVNRLFCGSKIFDQFKLQKEYDILVTFGYRNGDWTFSFYSESDGDVNCSLIAKSYGGGGHFHAAGCHISSFIIDENTISLKR